MPQETHEPSDGALVARVQRGDRVAFRLLFDRYHARAMAVAFGVVKHRQDASDVVQEAFLKVHRHIERFEGSSSFYTWFYRIVMNLAIDHVRKNRRTRVVDYDDTITHDEDGAVDLGWLPSILNANPGQVVLRKELGEAIERALAMLSEHHRAAIVLREIEGLSYEEIAEVQEVPKGTVMSRLFHARRNLQAALAPYLVSDLTVTDAPPATEP